MSKSTIRRDLFNLPNALTWARIAVIPLVVWLLDRQAPVSAFIASVVFGLASATDYFDGYLARKLGLVSLTGKFLDPLADKLMVMAALVQLASQGWVEPWIPIVLLSRELAVQGLRQIASAEGMVIAAGQGGKWKTAFQLIGLIGLLAHYSYDIDFGFVEVAINFHRVGWWMLVLSIIFSVYSAVQYFWGFLKAIESASKPS
ncbi:MAG: CDP-diacylglycerol--glycerol-3-phosphate 3-phosphatidyltransferase [Myxococcota bacterium]|nr:CDP-diacylglycerol--glycerol-3-phosphate 3-phosphatidyltransferase [Myxococcota bacterium]